MAEFLEDDDEYFFGQGAVLDGRSLEASRTQGEREYRALERSFKAEGLADGITQGKEEGMQSGFEASLPKGGRLGRALAELTGTLVALDTPSNSELFLKIEEVEDFLNADHLVEETVAVQRIASLKEAVEAYMKQKLESFKSDSNVKLGFGANEKDKEKERAKTEKIANDW